MPRISRFLLYNDDRTGFKKFKIYLVKDGQYLVDAGEFDVPPPSRRPLGGEGEIAAGDYQAALDFTNFPTAADTPAAFDNPTVAITAAGGITPSFTHPYMRVTGSNSAVTISAVPPIARGQQNQILTLQCVDSTITITQGSGINLMGSQNAVLGSGGYLTLVYTTGGQVWNEASRNPFRSL